MENHDYEKIIDVIIAFNNEKRYDKLLDIILEKMMDLTCSDAGTLYVVEDDHLHFRILKNKTLNVFKTVEDMIDLPPIKLDKNNIDNVSAYVAINNEIIEVDDVYTSEKFNFSGPKKYDELTGYKTRSMLVLPLSVYQDNETEVFGVMQLLNATNRETGEIVPYVNTYNPPLVPALANIAAATLANITYVKDVNTLIQSFVVTMAQAIDERSKYNSNHTLKVTELCKAFTRYLNQSLPEDHPYYFDDRQIEEFSMAASLHDIGKITTPVRIMDKAFRLGDKLTPVKYRFEIKRHQLEIDMLKGEITKEERDEQIKALDKAEELIASIIYIPILSDEQISEIKKLKDYTYRDANNKNIPILDSDDIEDLSIKKGTLTAHERTIMQDHALITNKLVNNMTFSKYYKNVPLWAGNHHELLDGTGYPNGIKDIPLEVCILTIVDIFEALTAADRPYKSATSIDSALEILANMAEHGKLHRDLVQLFKESEAWKGII